MSCVLVAVQPERDARRLVRFFRDTSERAPALRELELWDVNVAFLPVRCLPRTLCTLKLHRPLMKWQWAESLANEAPASLQTLELHACSTPLPVIAGITVIRK